MINRIEVTGIEVYAYHGCLPEETLIGGQYVIDLWVDTDLSQAANSDKLGDTVDYVWLTGIVIEEMAITAKLIEHVANRILTRIKTDKRIVKAGLRLRKLAPPINANVAEVAVVFSC